MNLLKHWKIILSLSAIFTAGMVAGGSLTLAWAKNQQLERTSVDFYTEATMNRLVKELQLTPAQAQKIQPVIADTGTEMNGLYRDTLQRVWTLIDASSNKIEEHLDEKQKGRFKSYLAEVRKKFNARMSQGTAG